MSKSKKHHYVPQSLLRNFSVNGEGKMVVVFDKSTEKVFESAITDAGAENHFNAIDLDGVSVNLEEMFQGLDDRFANLVSGITTKRSLRHLLPRDRYDLAVIAVVQIQRVKLQRTTMMELPEQLRAMLKSRGVEPSEDVLPRINENEAKRMTLHALRQSHDLAMAILDKDWSLHEAPPGSEFWISDNPIVTNNVFPFGDLGLRSPGVQVSWPLSSNIVLTFLCRSVAAKAESVSPDVAEFLRGEPTIRSDAREVACYNSLQVFQSGRFLYSATADFALASRIIAEHPDAANVKTHFATPELGKIPRNERMPSGMWLTIFGKRTQYLIPVSSWKSERGKPLKVCVHDKGFSELQRALADMPHSEIGVYQDGHHRVMMREISITPDAENAKIITIVHSDAGLQKIMQSHGPSESSGDQPDGDR